MGLRQERLSFADFSTLAGHDNMTIIRHTMGIVGKVRHRAPWEHAHDVLAPAHSRQVQPGSTAVDDVQPMCACACLSLSALHASSLLDGKLGTCPQHEFESIKHKEKRSTRFLQAHTCEARDHLLQLCASKQGLALSDSASLDVGRELPAFRPLSPKLAFTHRSGGDMLEKEALTSMGIKEHVAIAVVPQVETLVSTGARGSLDPLVLFKPSVPSPAAVITVHVLQRVEMVENPIRGSRLLDKRIKLPAFRSNLPKIAVSNRIL